MVNYIIVDKLSKTADFQFSLSQRQLILDATMSALEAEDISFFTFYDNCKNNHDTLTLIKLVLWASTNTLLNNLCFKQNDSLIQENKKEKTPNCKLKSLLISVVVKNLLHCDLC